MRRRVAVWLVAALALMLGVWEVRRQGWTVGAIIVWLLVAAFITGALVFMHRVFPPNGR